MEITKSIECVLKVSVALHVTHCVFFDIAASYVYVLFLRHGDCAASMYE